LVAPADPFHHNVSVIVLNYNHAETTLECLDALAKAHSPLIREIIVVDNGSRAEQVAILRTRHKNDDFLLVEVGENRFFSEGNNIGVDFASGAFIVFLNNDAFVQPGWIEALADTMRRDPMVAAVGPMFLYPDGRVQEVGGVALPTGDVLQVGKGSVWGPDHFDTECPVDFCSAACLMMRRKDFIRVGGLGFEWEPAYYEDVDLCLKLWTHCGKVMVNPRARVIHIESKTTSDSRLQLQNISEINRIRFVAKWSAWLEARQTRHLEDLDLAPEAELNELSSSDVELLADSHTDPEPQFVLFSPYALVPGGGERVMFELAAFLSSLVGTSNVVFSTPYRYSAIRMRQIAATFGFDHVVGTPLPLDLVDSDTCRFAVVLGNSIIPPVPAFGERCVYQLQFPFYMPDKAVAEGAALLAGYDEIWVYSDFVRRNVNGLIRHYGIAAPPVRVIEPPAAWSDATSGVDWVERKTILTVGRFFAGGHNKRQDIVIDAFRQVVESGTEGLQLALAGSIHPSPAGRSRFQELQAMAVGLDCTFYPNIARTDLAELYGRSAVLVHAAGFGVDPDEFPETLEHFGITPVEAASFGCIPVVYGQGGPKEVVHALGCDTTFSTIEEAAQIVTELLDDPLGSAELSTHLLQSSQLFSAEAFRSRIQDALHDLGVC
jgi:GT2 family glycosyltransferase/glycosyltransferase involved in cell wall biosynthesis